MKGRHSALSACALAITLAVMAATIGAYPHEPAKSDAKPMSAEQGDHSKMNGTKDMGGMKPKDGMLVTGNVDFDFAANMRTHHQMALDMAQAQLKNGKDANMQKMAKKIIAAQTREIAELDQWLAAHKSSAPMKDE